MRTFARAVVVAGVATGACLPMAGAGADQAVPFHDTYARGFIALCDQHGNAVTGGPVDGAPFVWKAVSSFAPPAGYLGRGENAVLTVYQARQGVDPADWNGDQLTGASYYSDARLPTAQATKADIPLSVIVKEFPPLWDGLYELRMMFAKTGYGNYTAVYPATVIRVRGDRWSVVSGGALPCGRAHGVSNESFVPQRPRQAAAKPGTGVPSAAAVSSGVAPAAADVGDRPATAAAATRGSRHLPLLIGGAFLGAVLAAGLLVAGIRRRGRRRLSPPPSSLTGAAGEDRAAATSGRTLAR